MKTLWNVLLSCLFLFVATGVVAQSASDWNQKGIEALKQERYREAISAFTKAIFKNPQNGDFYWNRGYAYHKMALRNKNNADFGASNKDFEKALPYYTRSRQKLSRLYYTRGQNYLRMEDFEDAILDFTNALLVNKDNAKKYYFPPWPGLSDAGREKSAVQTS